MNFNNQLIESLEYHINNISLVEEDSLVSKLKDNLKNYRDTDFKAWNTAKNLIDKAKEDYKIQHDYNSTKHPFIIGLQDAIYRQGTIVLSIVLGLLLVYVFSFNTSKSFKDLLKLIFRNIKSKLLLYACIDMGVTPLYYKLRSKFMSESLETDKEKKPKRNAFVKVLKDTVKDETKHWKRGLAGASVGGAIGTGAGYLIGRKFVPGGRIPVFTAGLGGLIGARLGGEVTDQASRDADRIKKEYAEFQKRHKNKGQ